MAVNIIKHPISQIVIVGSAAASLIIPAASIIKNWATKQMEIELALIGWFGLLIIVALLTISVFQSNKALKKKDKVIEGQEKIIKKQKKSIKELKAQKATTGAEVEDEKAPEEKLLHSQEEVVGCLNRLMASDPDSRTKADSILEYDCMDKLEEVGIPIYLLQGSHEIETCKKLIEELGLDEGLKRIKEKGTDLVFI